MPPAGRETSARNSILLPSVGSSQTDGDRRREDLPGRPTVISTAIDTTARTVDSSARVGVIGSGIAGAGVAFSLASRGVDVTIVDDAMGGQATAASAGIIAPRSEERRVGEGAG